MTTTVRAFFSAGLLSTPTPKVARAARATRVQTLSMVSLRGDKSFPLHLVGEGGLLSGRRPRFFPSPLGGEVAAGRPRGRGQPPPTASPPPPPAASCRENTNSRPRPFHPC